GGTRRGRGREVVPHLVVGDRIESGAQRQARHDLPLVLDAAEAAELVFLEVLVDEEAVQAALLVPREDVAILERAAEAAPLEGVHADRGVLAVRDRPEERNLRVEALRGPAPPQPEQKPRLPAP